MVQKKDKKEDLEVAMTKNIANILT